MQRPLRNPRAHPFHPIGVSHHQIFVYDPATGSLHNFGLMTEEANNKQGWTIREDSRVNDYDRLERMEWADSADVQRARRRAEERLTGRKYRIDGPLPGTECWEYADEFWTELARAVDPNARAGPAGLGEEGFVAPWPLVSYRVDFENEADATVPAQQVMVTDQLSSDLNWGTFELTEIGFGGELIITPDDTQHYEATVPMRYAGVDVEVWVEAGIRLSTGEVYATFYSIDPETGLPPAVEAGFLPPEDGTGCEQGHPYRVPVKYKNTPPEPKFFPPVNPAIFRSSPVCCFAA